MKRKKSIVNPEVRDKIFFLFFQAKVIAKAAKRHIDMSLTLVAAPITKPEEKYFLFKNKYRETSNKKTVNGSVAIFTDDIIQAGGKMEKSITATLFLIILFNSKTEKIADKMLMISPDTINGINVNDEIARIKRGYPGKSLESILLEAFNLPFISSCA
jgi:hypothetical protein